MADNIKPKQTTLDKKLCCHNCGKTLAIVDMKPGSKVSIKCPRCKNINGFTA